MSAARKRRIVRLPPQVSIIKALERTQFGPPKTLAALVAQVFNIDLEVTTRMGNRSLRAFISSKMEELALERMTIRAALAELHIEAFVFEKDAGARPYSIQQTYLEELEAANLYIGVFWKGYGKYTIEEYEHAQTLGMDCLIYEKREEVGDGRDPELQAFLDRIGQVETGLTIRWFHTPEELSQLVKKNVSGWQFEIIEKATKPDAPAVYHGAPSKPPSDFVGRNQEIERMVRELRSGKDLAVDGLPGVGKTTLAVALVHHPGIRRRFKDGVLWASLGLNADVASALMNWANALEGAGILNEDASQIPGLAERAQVLRNAIGQRRMLLVIDDVWNIEAANTLRCGGPNCSHLVTTRDKGIAREFAGSVYAESLPTLDEIQALQLLQKLAPEACDSDPEGAMALAQAVGGLPLAIRLIGGYLAAADSSMFADVFTNLSADAFAEMTNPQKRLQLAGQRLGMLSGEKVTLRDTIALSLEGLPEGASNAYYRLGAFAPKPERFSPEAAEAVTEADARSLALLAARNLLEVDRASRRLSLHPIVADVARAKLEQATLTRHREYYLTFAHENAGQWQRVEDIYGQIRWAWQQASADQTLLPFLVILENFQISRGLLTERLVWAERVLRAAESEDFKPVIARTHMIMGLAYYRIGYRDKALGCQQQALAIWKGLEERSSDEETSLYRSCQVETLINIGYMLGNLGHPDEAIRELEKALALAEASDNRARQAEILLLFGFILRNHGRPTRAVEYIKHALQIYRELGDKIGEVDALGLLGTAYRDLNQPDLALEQVRQAFDISEEIGNPVSQTEMRMVTASVYRRQGRLEEALAIAEEALAKAESTGDRDLFVASLSALGSHHHWLQQPEKALARYQQRLTIEEETGNRIGQASALREIGWIHREQKRYTQALEANQQALATYEELGNEAEIASTLRAIRLVHYAQRFGERIFHRQSGVTPLAVTVGGEPAPQVQGKTGQLQNTLRDRIAAMQNRVYSSMGVSLPEVKVRTNWPGLKPGEYLILLDDAPIVSGTPLPDMRLYPGPLEDLASLGVSGEATINPQTGEPAVWVAREHWQELEAAGKSLWDSTEYLTRHLETVIRKNLGEFVGHQETMDMLEGSLPDAHRQMRDNPVELSILVAVLKNLVEEFAPIIHFRAIIETFMRLRAQGAERLDILRAIRLLPEIRPDLPGNDCPCYFYSLGAGFEEKINGSIQVVDSESYLALEPEDTQRCLKLVRENINSRPDLKTVTLLVGNGAIRRFVRRLVELEFPYLFVLSREELLSGVEDMVAGEIEW
jgi:tetratricopeptide (TPR) repeat protein